MTVVACFVNEDIAVMACDTNMQTEYIRSSIATKIVRLGGWLVGFSGENALRILEGFSSEESTAYDICDFYRKRSDELGLMSMVEGRPAYPANLLMARPGELWTTGTSGHPDPHTVLFMAIGSGSEIAMGAIYAGHVVGRNPNWIVHDAVAAAIHLSPSCAGDVIEHTSLAGVTK